MGTRQDETLRASPLMNPRTSTPPTVNAADMPTVLSPIPDDSHSESASPSKPPPASNKSLTAEARDYLNGGLPHTSLSPISNGPGAGKALPALPRDSSKSLSAAQENGNDGEGTVPSGRRSVQFARADPVGAASASHSRQGSWDDPDAAGKIRGTSFMSKLKALAVTGGLQTPKSPGLGAEAPPQSIASSPTVTRSARTLDAPDEADDIEADADAEETADESVGDDAKKLKKKRRIRRPRRSDFASFTSTPNTPSVRNINETDSPTNFGGRLRIGRRMSVPGTSDHHHGLSEGEGREELSRERPWRRGTSWMPGPGRGAHPAGQPGSPDPEDGDTPFGRRIGHLRRITYFGGGGGGGGGVSDGDTMTPRRTFFINPERASTFQVPKWPSMVKNTLKLWRQRNVDPFDYTKSAELMAELRAGAPAALMLASMIQRDEHGNKRIPVLLEQLKVRVSDSAPTPDDDSHRHWIFTLELEYGSGPSRMKWKVTRTLREIYELHLRYKFALGKDIQMSLPGRAGSADVGSRRKQPKFPLSTFPYLRNARGSKEDSDDDGQASVRGEETADEGTAGEGTASEMDGRPTHSRKRSRINAFQQHMRRKSTFTDPGDSAAEGSANPALVKQRHIERQRRLLQQYLQEMIRWLMFRADSNRLCRFLELSALGVRLAAEGSFHGKECYLHIQSSKGIDFRRVLTPKKVIARHSRKWFLIRQSYIVCVESPENMQIYDVYLVDPKFQIVSKNSPLDKAVDKGKEKLDAKAKEKETREGHHTLVIHTSERKVKLFSRKESVMMQFEESIQHMLKQTQWHDQNRFDSFAPVRTGVFAEWLVDGRDYMWNVSRAINMAKDVVYIHDWWLSPELYMRRPAAISQKWRLDRLLRRKAEEGVKVFVIVYRNIESAIPIDSEYTKTSLHDLHPNIFVQRSPNQFKKNQFFFAHHEKLCIVDHDIAFLGGIDLCFGRWDCPQHPLNDDMPTGFEGGLGPRDPGNCQVFLGKDYSNPRVHDFFRLDQPYEDMYDRAFIPRMPWHDVGMQIVGQPARDLTRHFVQRWNYLRRGRKPTRALPFLLPPPDAKPDEFSQLGLSGTCEVQILRSAAEWSLGIDEPEISIQNAYIKIIEDSEHFVYMENQFFVTSTEAYNTKILNRIGDALVDRIIRAHRANEDWKCFILIPLMPGFESSVDEQPGMSVRLIVQFQYRSICRGEHSIFERLRGQGIDPESYIQFFSLRKWGKLNNGALVTEQLYIHAKIIIADDRVALIGSANVNERSMLGTRDSETAAIVRDTDMIWSTMAGRPYQVGRFAHTLRLRLMREHLGLDVDEIEAEERQLVFDQQAGFEDEMSHIYSEERPSSAPSSSKQTHTHTQAHTQAPTPKKVARKPVLQSIPSFNHDAEPIHDEGFRGSPSKEKDGERDGPVADGVDHKLEVAGYGEDRWKAAEQLGLDEGRDSVVMNGREVLLHNISPEGKGTLDSPKKPHQRARSRSTGRASEPDTGGGENDALPPMPPINRRTTDQLGLLRANQLPNLPVVDDTDIGGPPVHLEDGKMANSAALHPLAADMRVAFIDKDCMRDPLNQTFVEDIWNATAENNTRLFRQVFRCMPDSDVKTWAEYRDFNTYNARFNQSMGLDKDKEKNSKDGKQEVAQQASSSAAGLGTNDEMNEKSHTKATEPNPAIIIPSMDGQNGMNGMNEKAGLDESNGARPKSQPKLNIDLEKAAALSQQQSRVSDNPSPVLPAGDIPFPSFDGQNQGLSGNRFLDPQQQRDKSRERRTTFSPLEKPPSRDTNASSAINNTGSVRRRRRATTKGSRGRGLAFEDVLTAVEAEELLSLTRGHLVQFPYDWLVTEESNSNWGYHLDGMAPINIYT